MCFDLKVFFLQDWFCREVQWEKLMWNIYYFEPQIVTFGQFLNILNNKSLKFSPFFEIWKIKQKLYFL